MKIETYMRSKVKKHFINLVKKESCECCGTSKELEVHHMKQFIDMLYESLDKLNIEYREYTDDYTENELDILTYLVLGVHLTNEYQTLCKKCHKDYHKQFGRKINKKSKNKYIPTVHEYTPQELLSMNRCLGELQDAPEGEVICMKNHNNIPEGTEGTLEWGNCRIDKDDRRYYLIEWSNGERDYYPETDNGVLYRITLISLYY